MQTEELKIGDQFGKATIIEIVPNQTAGSETQRQRIRVQCDCGYIREIYAETLKKTKQCWYCSHQPYIKYRKGDRYDKLVIKGFFRETHTNRNMVTCQCDCGKETTLFVGLLRKNKTHNCGCSYIGNYKGCGNLSGAYFGSLRLGAEKRHLAFELTIEQVWNLFQEQKQRCALTGIPIFLFVRNRKDGTASLDRIDSEKGYTIDNVQWVHKDINKIKQGFNQTHFIELCRMVVDHMQYGMNAETLIPPISRPRIHPGRKIETTSPKKETFHR